jgi:ribosomal protein S27AE
MHASEVTPAVILRANSLDWESERSVNAIADDLDLSKGALYGLIEPAPGDRDCPECGADTVYANRTAQQRDRPTCSECEWTAKLSTTESYDPSEAVTSPPGRSKAADSSARDRSREAQPLIRRPSTVASPRNSIMGGALLGAAVGLALVLWARRR